MYKPKILRKMEYLNHRIYVLHFDWVFQYFFADKDGNIYIDFITFKPTFLSYIKHKFRLFPVPYTRQEVEAAEEIALSGAMKSIDALLAGEKAKIKVDKKIAKTLKKGFSNECNWQAVFTDKDELAYKCLTHPGNIVKMAEGEKPFHTVEKILSPIQF